MGGSSGAGGNSSSGENDTEDEAQSNDDVDESRDRHDEEVEDNTTDGGEKNDDNDGNVAEGLSIISSGEQSSDTPGGTEGGSDQPGFIESSDPGTTAGDGDGEEEEEITTEQLSGLYNRISVMREREVEVRR